MSSPNPHQNRQGRKKQHDRAPAATHTRSFSPKRNPPPSTNLGFGGFGGMNTALDTDDESTSGLFRPPRAFFVDQSVNFMDHSNPNYPPTAIEVSSSSTRTKKRPSMVDVFLGSTIQHKEKKLDKVRNDALSQLANDLTASSVHSTRRTSDHRRGTKSLNPPKYGGYSSRGGFLARYSAKVTDRYGIQENKEEVESIWKACCFIVLLLVIMTIFMLSAAGVAPPFAPSLVGTRSSSASRSDKLQLMKEVLLERDDVLSSETLVSLNNKTTAFFAMRWLALVDNADHESDDTVLVERFLAAYFFYFLHPNVAKSHSSGETEEVHANWNHHDAWMSRKPLCDWYGIECEDGSVVKFNLTKNDLKGELFPEFGAFTNLRVLDLSHNLLSGEIPEGFLEGASNISTLSLSKNKLHGTIPPEVEELVELRELKLASNKFSGTLRASFFSMPNLRVLKLGNNELHGKLEFDISSSALNLTTLDLERNRLTGTIPKNISMFENLESLRLSYNKFIGAVPDEISYLTSLRELKLQKNQLTGTLPIQFESLSNLLSLMMDSNNFEGTIPRNWTTLTDLEVLDLHRNNINGPILPEIANWKSLRELTLRENLLTGSIPQQIGEMESLETLSIEVNQLNGTFPEELSKLTVLEELIAFDNDITGHVPLEVCSLKQQHNLEFLVTDCVRAIQCGCCDQCHR